MCFNADEQDIGRLGATFYGAIHKEPQFQNLYDLVIIRKQGSSWCLKIFARKDFLASIPSNYIVQEFTIVGW